MKKVLLATSALVMFAGAASAEIALSGSARMGVVYTDTGADSFAQFSSRVRIVFTASGETDGGLSFGASMRADQFGGNGGLSIDDANSDGIIQADEVSVNSNTSNGDSTVYISGAFGKLTMGDVSGAADALVGQVSGVGYGPNDAHQEIGFIGTDKTAVYYEYSSGAITFGAGIGQTETTRDTFNVGVKHATDSFSVAVGYENEDIDGLGSFDAIHLGGSATFGAATVKARISDFEAADDIAYALSVDYVTGATTLTGFYTSFSDDVSSIGLGAAYDLGGGATLAGGVVVTDLGLGGDDPVFADLGLKFSF